MSTVHCIHEVNPAGGFESTHRAFCAFGDFNAATAHIALGYWCGNVCSAHSTKMTGGKHPTHPKAVVSEVKVYRLELSI